MIQITDDQFRFLIVMGLGSLVLLAAMFIYCVRSARLAYLGERWVHAAGSYGRAARALRDFDIETDALIVEHAHRWPAGILVLHNRESVEALIARHASAKFGGPGL